MTTVTDLRAELDRCAELAPSDAEIRQALAHRVREQAKRRRSTALIGAAAAVVLVAGGAGIAGAVLSHRSAGPAAPTPVVSVPEVPLAPDTKLVRHQLQAVTTPVTATPPTGLSGQIWFSSPGRLAVSWFDPGTGSEPAYGSTSYSAAGASVSTAGYVVTDDRDDPVIDAGPGGPSEATVSSQGVTVAGHPAVLETAPAGSTDQVGLPAAERITWQLADGRWIHVWSSGSGRQPSPTAALRDFAGTITETPQTLNRTVGIGLTLPGLTVDSSINSSPLATVIGAQVYLCPPGVDPLVASFGSSSGSGSAEPSASLAPGESASPETETERNPTATCVTAAVMNYPLDQSTLPVTNTIAVGDTVAHVDGVQGAAWTDLGNGLTAVVAGPRSAHLSEADLAALVASVRLSPAVTVLPLQTPQVVQMSGAASAVTLPSMVKAVPPPAKPSSSAALMQSTSGTERPDGTKQVMVPNVRGMSAQAATKVILDRDLDYQVVYVHSSSAVAGRVVNQSPEPGIQVPDNTTIEIQVGQDSATIADRAAASTALTKYLDAFTAGDCAAAREYAAPSFVIGNGELCGAVQVSTHSAPKSLTTLKPDERDFEVTLTTGGSADGSIPPGALTWFYIVQRQTDGHWLITGGDSGI